MRNPQNINLGNENIELDVIGSVIENPNVGQIGTLMEQNKNWPKLQELTNIAFLFRFAGKIVPTSFEKA